MKPIVLRLKRKGPEEGYSVCAEHPEKGLIAIDCPNGIAFLTSDIATVLSGFDLTEPSVGISDATKHDDDYAAFILCVMPPFEGKGRVLIRDIIGDMLKCVEVPSGDRKLEALDMVSYVIVKRIDPSVIGRYILESTEKGICIKLNPDYIQPPTPRYYKP